LVIFYIEIELDNYDKQLFKIALTTTLIK